MMSSKQILSLILVCALTTIAFASPNQKRKDHHVLGNWRVKSAQFDLSITFHKDGTMLVVHNDSNIRSKGIYTYDQRTKILMTTFRQKRTRSKLTWKNEDEFREVRIGTGATYVWRRK